MNAPALAPALWPANQITLANLGHATVLTNYMGVRAISDPTLFAKVGFSFASAITIGPRRLIAPPLSYAELGPIDLVLLTHAHLDHLDRPSLDVMPKSAVVVGFRGCERLIRPLGFRDVRALAWGEQTDVEGLTIAAMGARHWGKRWPPLGRDYGFNSYVLEKDGRRMLLGCDSASTDIFDALADAPPELAAFSISAYDPWISSHANPEQVWTMFQATRARWLMPIHWGTFRLSREPTEEPLRRLVAAAGEAGDRIILREVGAAWTMPRASDEIDVAANRAG